MVEKNQILLLHKIVNKKLKILVETLHDPLATFFKSNPSNLREYENKPDMAIAAGLALKGLVDNE